MLNLYMPAPSKLKYIISSLIILSSISAGIALAAPRTSPFTIGQTIDPGAEFTQPCGPLETNCFVAVLSVDDEGSPLTLNAVKLSFIGTGVTATTNASGTVTITIPGGAGTTTQSMSFTPAGNLLTSSINGVSTTTTIGELRNLLLSGTTTFSGPLVATSSPSFFSSVFTNLIQGVTATFTNLFASVANFGQVLTGNITATGTASFATTTVGGVLTVNGNTVNNGNLNVTGSVAIGGTTTLATTTVSNLLVTSLSVPNTLTSFSNTLTSNIGGSLATSSIITASSLTASGTVLTSNINGVLATTSLASIATPITKQNGNSLFSTGLVNTGLGSLAVRSNFFGDNAGNGATNASASNFFGEGAGQGAASAGNSNFFGRNAGLNATRAQRSNFFGNAAGNGATDATAANFFGNGAGLLALNAANANFFGNGAGANATDANSSNFFGSAAGSSAVFASNANFFGTNAGQGATDARDSNFFGNFAGDSATGAFESNFFGISAGQGASSATQSNFFGSGAGLNATNAAFSNFFGRNAGDTATDARFSNFFGENAGSGANLAANSNFSGQLAGSGATNAFNSNFFGLRAGQGAVNAANSIFIGEGAGQNDTVDNTAGGTSILIGKDTSTGGFVNSIALGEGAVNTAKNQLYIRDTISNFNLAGVNYIFPTAQATAPGQVLTNDGSGSLTWGTVSAGVPDTNFATTDLTATGNRVHNFANKSLTLNSLSVFQLASSGGHNYSAGGLVDYVSGTGFRFLSPLMHVESLVPNTSGLRLVNLTSASATTTANGKALTVNASGDVVLVDNVAVSPSTIAANSGFIQNGNSFGALATLGTNDNNALAFKTNSIERMRIFSNGQIAMGTLTPNPFSRFEVSGFDNTGNGLLMTIRNTNTSPASYGVLNMKAGTGSEGGDITGSLAADTSFGIVNGLTVGAGTAAQDIGFRTGTAQFTGSASGPSMIVKASGNVGIGTNNPNNKLEITSALAGTSGLRFTNLLATSATSSANGKALSVNASGDVTLVDILSAGNVWSTLGNTGTASSTNFIGTTDAQDLVFRTNNVNRLRVTSDGKLLTDNAPNNLTNQFIKANFYNSISGQQSALQVTNGATGNTFTDGLLLGVGSGVANAYLTNQENTQLALGTNGAFQMYFDPSGNIGVGTGLATVPGNRFEIKSLSADASGLRFTNLLATSATTTANGKMLTVSNSGDVILVDSPAALTLGAPVASAINGGSITGNILSLALANSANPGLVSTTTQVFSGLKTFSTDASSGSMAQFNNAAPGGSRLFMNNTGGSNVGFGLQTAGVLRWSNAAFQANAGTNLDYSFFNDQTSTSAMLIDGNTNNIGIGTSSPGNALTVASSSGAISGLRLGINAATATTTANGKMLTVNASGDVVLVDNAQTTSIALSALTAATAANTIDNTNFAQVWNWSTAAAQTGLTLNANALTSGRGLALASSATGLTGDLQNITLSGNSAANTGNLLSLSSTGANSIATGLSINTASSAGLALQAAGAIALKKGADYAAVGTTSNVAFANASLVRLTGASAQTITGIAGGVDGKLLTLINAGSNTSSLTNLDGASIASNQITTGTGATLALAPNASVQLVYDSGASLWRVVGGSGSGSTNTSVALGNFAAGGVVGTAATTVDVANNLNITQTTAEQTLSLPNPTVLTAGKTLTVNNVGSAVFTMYSSQISPAGAGIFVWNGTAWNAVQANGSNVAAEFGENNGMTNGQTTTSTTFGDITGSTFTLPSAGTWEATYYLTTANTSAGNGGNVRMTDSAGTVVPNSQIAELPSSVAVGYRVSSSQSVRITTTGSATYKLQWRVNAGTMTIYNGIGPADGNSKIIWQKISGNAPVLGQTVDYIQANTVPLGAAYSSNIGIGDHIKFTGIETGNITLDTATTYTAAQNVASLGRFTLLAGKTYRLTSTVAMQASAVGGRIGYAWFNADTGIQIGREGAAWDTQSTDLNAAAGGQAEAIFTPSVNTRVEVRITGAASVASVYAGNSNLAGTRAAITQLGASTFTAGTGLSFDSLRAAVASNALDNTNYTQTWDWSTLTTGTGLSMSANSLTNGSLQKITTSSIALSTAGLNTGSLLDVQATGALTSFSGSIANINLTNTTGNTGNTGSLLNINDSGAANRTKLLTLTSLSTNNPNSILAVNSLNAGAISQGIVRFDFLGAYTGDGVQVNSNTLAGNGMAINANSLTTGSGLVINSNAAITGTAGLANIRANNSTAGTLLNLSGTSLLSASGAGIRLSTNSAPGIVSNTSGEDLTSPSGTALIVRAGTGVGGDATFDSGTVGNVNIGTGANAKTITVGNATGATALTFNSGTGLQSFNSLAATTNAFNFVANNLTTGNGLALSSTNTALTGNLLSVTSASTGAFANGGVRLNFTGNHGGNGLQIDDLTTAGTVMRINANSITTGTGFDLTTTNTAIASTNGFFRVAQLASGGAGTTPFARIQPNNFAGSGLTISNNGNTTIGAVGSGSIFTFGVSSATSSQAQAVFRGGSIFTDPTVPGSGSIKIGNSLAGQNENALYIEWGGSNGNGLMRNNFASGNVDIVANSAGVRLAPGGTSWTAISDNRIKSNILNLNASSSVLSKILGLDTVTYDLYNGNHEIGVIAQNLRLAFPELVINPKDNNAECSATNQDGCYRVNYDRLGVVALSGIKELNAKLDSGFSGYVVSTSTPSTPAETEVSQQITDILAEVPRVARDYFTTQMLAGRKAVKDFASERITALNGYFENLFAKKIRTEQLCVKKSDNTEICINGDQLQTMLDGRPAASTGSGQTGASAGGSTETTPSGGDTPPMTDTSTGGEAANPPTETAPAPTPESVP